MCVVDKISKMYAGTTLDLYELKSYLTKFPRVPVISRPYVQV